MSTKQGKRITRSRKGCHNCKRLKIKCNEGKPKCSNCTRSKTACDYSLKLTWGGRPARTEKVKKPQNLQADSFQVSGRGSDDVNLSSSPASSLGEKPHIYDPYKVLGYRTPVGSMSYVPNSSQELATRGTLEGHQPSPPPDIKEEHTGLSPFANQSLSLGSDVLFKYNTLMECHSSTQVPDLNDHILNHGLTSQTDLYHMQPTDSISLQVGNFPMSMLSSLVESLPEISDGVEVLSNALNRISGKSHQFNIRHSSMLNNYIQNLEERSTAATDDESNETDLSQVKLGDYLDPYDYSQDLAKIEEFSPRSPTGLSKDFQDIQPIIFQGNARKRSFDEYLQNIDPLDEPYRSLVMSSPGSTSLLQHIPTPSEVFSQVPAPLTPFPELLLKVPFYRSLMHFWVHMASLHLVPAPSHLYLDNPFKVLLPQMAMEYPAILTTLLAFSASAKALLTGLTEVPQVIIDQLLARSCKELLKLLKDKKEATSDGTLATVLMLSSYEAFNSINFERSRAHTVGARQIVKARRLILPRGDDAGSPESDKGDFKSLVVQESDIAYFLMRWFVYLDVIGALSATKNSHNYLTTRNYMGIDARAHDLDEEDIANIPLDPKRDIDHLLGFDAKFLPLFSDVVLLIRESEKYVAENGNTSLPILVVTHAAELRDSIARTYEIGEARRNVTIDIIKDREEDTSPSKRQPKSIKRLIDQHTVLQGTNKMFCDMVLLNLYRRALLVPRESFLVQKLANDIFKILRDKIEPKSTAETCIIFCTFCAACETLDPEARALFEERIGNMAKTGYTNAAKGLTIMYRCWETGESWNEAAQHLDIDLTLL